MITTANVQPERKKQAEIDIGLSSILDSQDFQQEMCNYAKAGDFSLSEIMKPLCYGSASLIASNIFIISYSDGMKVVPNAIKTTDSNFSKNA